jgi:Domain of unknown function (DUF4886)
MAITVACECGWKMPVKDELAGKLIRCPLCEGEVVVPEPTAGKSAGASDSSDTSVFLGPRRKESRGKTAGLFVAAITIGALISCSVATLWPFRGSNSLAEVRSSKKGVRVLFVGNSCTHFHDMPRMVRELSEAAGEDLPLMAVQEAPGGCTLRGHWENGKVDKMLEEIPWDYVVLQEQSQRPSFSRSQRLQEMYPYARQLDAKIRDRGSRTVLFMTWGYKDGDRRNVPGDTYAAMQERLRQGYLELAGELSAEVAPVGLAWAQALRLKPELELWASDGMHPSLQGSYLSACVFYALLYGKDPTGNAFTAGLNESEAKFLQEIAGTSAGKRYSQGGRSN